MNVQMVFCQIGFKPPYPNKKKRTLCDNGKALFFDGILMDIMVDNGDI